MGLSRSGCWWLLLLACGCAQASVGESATNLTDPSDAMVEHDGAQLGDASVVDAACRGADQDNDGVCVPEDNCPTAHNPDQADRDRDGKGDACDQDACDIDSPSDHVVLPTAKITSVEIDGKDNVARLDRGQTFELTFDYDLSLCVPGVGVVFTRPLQAGFEDQPKAQCTVTHTCNLMPSIGHAAHTFQAPDVPGVYYLKVRLTEGSLPACMANTPSAWIDESPVDVRIAAICVRE